MNIKEVKDLIHEILQSDIVEFELEQTGTKVKLRRGDAKAAPAAVTWAQVQVPPTALEPPPAERVMPPTAPTEVSADNGLHSITSPIVGTFYRAPSPGADPYVKIGDMIEEGSVLCIIEAMKLMNEIPSDVAGTVEKIYVENGHPVEYGQLLFGIRIRER
ncbi:MAG: acetyl-CoA carboxylase biotin carboxyl carrier protein [Acidobacteria bacterium]|nr:acetyl-CoA carboxylase biotin carboxyl carrier protein [Acidobacteriota bacterium]